MVYVAYSMGSHTCRARSILMMAVEHEAQHRSELASYMTELSVEPPHIS